LLPRDATQSAIATASRLSIHLSKFFGELMGSSARRYISG